MIKKTVLRTELFTPSCNSSILSFYHFNQFSLHYSRVELKFLKFPVTKILKEMYNSQESIYKEKYRGRESVKREREFLQFIH